MSILGKHNWKAGDSITPDRLNNLEEFRDLLYPVGSIFLTISSENPSEKIGGTWRAFAAGRCLFGVNANDTDFNSAKDTWTKGEKTHNLSTSEIPSHTHSVPGHNHSVSGTALTANSGGSHYHKVYTVTDQKSAGAGNTRRIENGVGSGSAGQTTSAGAHTHSINSHSHTVNGGACTTGGSGSSVAHNNLPPYATCYMWIRTA